MISSLVVVANDEFKNEFNIENASIEQQVDDKYIVLIEAEDFDSTLRIFNRIKQLKSVIDVNMAFSEAEDFDLNINAQKIADKVNELCDKDDIEYYGSVYKKY